MNFQPKHCFNRLPSSQQPTMLQTTPDHSLLQTHTVIVVHLHTCSNLTLNHLELSMPQRHHWHVCALMSSMQGPWLLNSRHHLHLAGKILYNTH
jgi:hypothetical protein